VTYPVCRKLIFENVQQRGQQMQQRLATLVGRAAVNAYLDGPVGHRVRRDCLEGGDFLATETR